MNLPSPLSPVTPAVQPIIDCHIQVFPDYFQHMVSPVADPFLSSEQVQFLKRQARQWMKPVTSSVHRLQTVMRYFPESMRRSLDQLGGLTPLPGLIIESTLQDLQEAMAEARVQAAWVVAQPPLISNEFVLELCRANANLFPVVNVTKEFSGPGMVLRQYIAAGAKALKLHPAMDGEGPETPRFRALLRVAEEYGLPVILHTGCLQCQWWFADPELGHAERFSAWFANYSQVHFILAHMNFHKPNIAIDLCEEFSNISLETSWQPIEVISEAARRIGAERLLFGSDWPFVGANMSVGVKRIGEGLLSGLLSQTQAELILGKNALKIFPLTTTHTNTAGLPTD